MNHIEASYRKEIWAGNVKVIICILVAPGYFFQSMTRLNILLADDLYEWFGQTICFFHMPLSLTRNGYLYQRFSRMNDIHSWGKSVFKKVLTLGVPYFIFSFATRLLKIFFSGPVNSGIGGLFEMLFLNPASPYRHLYYLSLTFLATPTFRSARMAIAGLAPALTAKTVSIIGGELDVWARGWWGGGRNMQHQSYFRMRYGSRLKCACV